LFSVNYPMTKWDVIIVGLGPAGSTSAKVLASKGFKTLVLEAAKFPRLKVCAGGVSIRVIKRYKLDLEDWVKVRRLMFVSPKGYYYEVDPGRVLGINIPRADFDNILAERAREAGAEIIEETYVKGVKVEKDGVKVYTRDGRTFEGRTVVGADGVNSIVARSLGLMPPNWYRDNAFCPVAYVPSPPPGEDEPQNEFYMGFMGAGYAWIFKHKDHWNIGIGTLRVNYKEHPSRGLEKFMKEHPVASKRIKGKPEKVLGFYIPYNGMLRKLYTDRAVLIGDAGGFVNTLTGEGIRMGMLTAELSAEVLEKALNEDDLSAERLSEYQRKAEKHPEVGEELRLGRLLRKIMFKDMDTLDEMIRVAEEDEKLRKLLVAVIYTLKPYPELVSELIKTMSLSLSLKLFKIDPGDIFRLVMGGGDPYFPR